MRKRRPVGSISLLLVVAIGIAWGTDGWAQDVSAHARGIAPDQTIDGASKIRFDLSRLNAEGLQGPPSGLRALHYEYCIPDRADAIGKVTAIDPTLSIQRGSPGRAGCGERELLCLGHTHQSGYPAALEQLAALSMVSEIREAFFE